MTLKETLRKEFGSKFNIAYVHDKGFAFLGAEIQDFLDQAYDRIEAETAKAFGGCKSCYGKGYATVRETAGTSKGVWLLNPVVPCHYCDRGQQIAEMHDRIREDSLREADSELSKIKQWVFTAAYGLEVNDDGKVIPRARTDQEYIKVAEVFAAIQSLITKK